MVPGAEEKGLQETGDSTPPSWVSLQLGCQCVAEDTRQLSSSCGARALRWEPRNHPGAEPPQGLEH